MAKAKLIYDASQPTTRNIRIIDINDKYIYDYISDNVEGGKIKKAQLQKWITDLKKIEDDTKTSKQKKFAAKRKLFVNTFIPKLAKDYNLGSKDYGDLLLKAKDD